MMYWPVSLHPSTTHDKRERTLSGPSVGVLPLVGLPISGCLGCILSSRCRTRRRNSCCVLWPGCSGYPLAEISAVLETSDEVRTHMLRLALLLRNVTH